LHLAKFLKQPFNKNAMTKKNTNHRLPHFRRNTRLCTNHISTRRHEPESFGVTANRHYDVRIDYDRPIVNGREGKIWGGLVHYGLPIFTTVRARLRHGAQAQMKIQPLRLVRTSLSRANH